MTKLSDLLVRNRQAPARELGSDMTIDADAVAEESDSEASARLGEECEALRNLMLEAGCKVNEFEETRQTFIKIVDSADRALQALEFEKTRNIGLTRKLGQLRTSYDALAVNFEELEKNTGARAAETEQVKLRLEEEQRAVRELTAVKAELTNDVAVVRAMAADLNRQVADLSARGKLLSEDNQQFRGRAVEAETKTGGLESELTAARETLTIVQGENESLQNSLGQAVSEAASLSKRNTELEAAATAATARIQQLEATLFGVENDRNKLLVEVNELGERQRNTHNRLQAQLEALQARAAMAEKLLGNTRELLGARSEEAKASSQQVTDVKRARDSAEVKVREIEALLKAHENQIRELERARAVLSERNGVLANMLKSRDAQVAEAEEQKLMTTDQIARLEDELKTSRAAFARRVDELLSQLDHERLQRQVLEGALDATRGERAQLQSELYSLRRALRRAKPSEETEPETPQRGQYESDRSADAA